MEKKNCFFKTLSFTRQEDGSKVATFNDKKGEDSLVITTWNGIIPGLRYNCKLEIGGSMQKDVAIPKRLYIMQGFKLWRDKIDIVTTDSLVQVTLDETVVENLTFDSNSSLDYEEKVDELKEYFKNKTFQLRGHIEINAFINAYAAKCKKIYTGVAKEVKKNASFEGMRIK